MNRNAILRIVFYALMAVSVLSCSKTKPSYNRENLKGTWVADVYDGSISDPYKWTVQAFDKNGTLTLCGVKDLADGNRTWGSCQLSYEAYCCDMSYSGNVAGFFGIPVSADIDRNYSFVSSRDSLVTLEIVSEKINDEPVISDHNRLTMRKLNKNFAKADSLLGIWKTYTCDGEQFESWQFIFESSDKLTLLVKDNQGKWTVVGDGTDTYKVYSDFIVLTLKNNPYLGRENATDVAFFTKLVAYPKSSFMACECDGHLYSFTFVAPL